ncbi:AAA family ATPase [Fructobacillus parabroussonetiae]|uniref:AAA family ATPase n=1 Tax=Fructobacillus parabroussonetiae TaxID=2713174 RepID=UPI00200A8E85|nr:AAA family ATPase [Fructobacillus parabroussonetiae]
MSNFGYIFADNKIEDFKKTNFIYGKNGTGKSSLTRAIVQQYSKTDEVNVFTGFEEIIAENHELNSIALGEENVENDRKIAEVSKTIKKLNTKLDPDNPKSELAKLRQKEEQLNKSEKNLDKFFVKESKKIKQHEPQISKQEYWKNDLKKEILDSRVDEYSNISEEDLINLEKTVTETTKPDPVSMRIPKIDFKDLLIRINNILEEQITPFYNNKKFRKKC